MNTREPSVKAPARRPGSFARTARIVERLAADEDGVPLPDARAGPAARDARSRRGRAAGRASTAAPLELDLAVEREASAARARSSTIRATASPFAGPHHRRGLDRFGPLDAPARLRDPVVDDLARASGVHAAVGRRCMTSAAIIARASRTRPPRTFWITERRATIAPTPIATQTKKNSSRRQEARSSRTRHPKDEASWRGTAAVLDHPAVAQRDRDVGAGRQLRIVRHQHQRRLAGAVDAEQQLDDRVAGGGIEVAGGLVGEQQRRIVGQRAGDGDALLLAAGELRRIVMAAVGQADLGAAARSPAAPRRARRRSPSAPARSRRR